MALTVSIAGGDAADSIVERIGGLAGECIPVEAGWNHHSIRAMQLTHSYLIANPKAFPIEYVRNWYLGVASILPEDVWVEVAPRGETLDERSLSVMDQIAFWAWRWDDPWINMGRRAAIRKCGLAALGMPADPPLTSVAPLPWSLTRGGIRGVPDWLIDPLATPGILVASGRLFEEADLLIALHGMWTPGIWTTERVYSECQAASCQALRELLHDSLAEWERQLSDADGDGVSTLAERRLGTAR